MNAEVILKSLEKVGDNLENHKGQMAELADRLLSLEQRGTGSYFDAGTGKANPLAKLANDQGIADVRDRRVKSASVDLGDVLATKAVAGDAGAEQYEVAPTRDSRLSNDPRLPLSIFDIFPRIRVGSNAFEFNRLDAYSNAAAYQASEGAAKAAGALPTALISAPICTIAHYFKLSEQVLADAPQLQQQAGNLLRYGVMAKAQAEIVAGATAGKIQGLITQATTFTPTAGGKKADDIGEAMTSLQVDGWNPGVVILHPNDWHVIRSERTATEKAYVAGGWDNPSRPNIWGTPVITSASLTAGTALVLDPSQVAILDRMDARLEVGREADDMTKNLVTMLAEMRLGLAVFSTSAVRKLSLSDA